MKPYNEAIIKQIHGVFLQFKRCYNLFNIAVFPKMQFKEHGKQEGPRWWIRRGKEEKKNAVHG